MNVATNVSGRLTPRFAPPTCGLPPGWPSTA